MRSEASVSGFGSAADTSRWGAAGNLGFRDQVTRWLSGLRSLFCNFDKCPGALATTKNFRPAVKHPGEVPEVLFALQAGATSCHVGMLNFPKITAM